MPQQSPPSSDSDEGNFDTSSEDLWRKQFNDKLIRFEDLAPFRDVVWIEEAGLVYRLRKTRLGKLVLSK